MRTKDLAKELGVRPKAYSDFRKRLRRLADDGTVSRIRGGRYALPGVASRIVGTLSLTRAGDGFVRPDLIPVVTEGEEGDNESDNSDLDGPDDASAPAPPDDEPEDIFIPSHGLGNALGGDRVAVRIEDRPHGKNPVGSVIEVVGRRRTEIVGTYEQLKNFGFVVPTDPKVRRDVLIPQGKEGDAKHGDAVVASISMQGTRHHGPLGAITRVLGRADDPEIEILAIALGFDFDPEFPPEVEAAAEKAAEGPLGDRVDLRDTLILTIDPETARDHDDAVSLVPVEGGGWDVGIHIADVSHYVQPDSVLDREACARGTSVYMVDRVIPMLPHRLSSDICSLVPDQDRAALSVFLRILPNGAITSTRVERTLIRSQQRLSYERAQAVLDREESISPEVDRLLHDLAAASRARREARFARGSLDFDLPEAKVQLGEDGVPTHIELLKRIEAHRLIEDLMLAANESVAALCLKKKVSVPFRVHEPPSGKGLERLTLFLTTAGKQLSSSPTPQELQGVLQEFEGSPLQTIAQVAVLRALKRAEYLPDNLGHFGLGADAYLHFTSPIRRYPDLVTHRHVVRALVEGKKLPEEWEESLPIICRSSSDREREADDAQRDSVALKQAEYMERHLGEHFKGKISGVAPFGFFVTLEEVYVEGLVHVSSLNDDFYEHLAEEFSLVGRRSGRRFSIGDHVDVTVALVDKRERKIDLVLRSNRQAKAGNKKGRRSRRND